MMGTRVTARKVEVGLAQFPLFSVSGSPLSSCCHFLVFGCWLILMKACEGDAIALRLWYQ